MLCSGLSITFCGVYATPKYMRRLQIEVDSGTRGRARRASSRTARRDARDERVALRLELSAIERLVEIARARAFERLRRRPVEIELVVRCVQTDLRDVVALDAPELAFAIATALNRSIRTHCGSRVVGNCGTHDPDDRDHRGEHCPHAPPTKCKDQTTRCGERARTLTRLPRVPWRNRCCCPATDRYST